MVTLGLLLAGGFVAGGYGTLIGAGGGILMVPLLLLMFPDASASAVAATSLVAVLFTGMSATIAYSRLGRIDYKLGIVLALATVPGAVLGAFLTGSVPRGAFQAALGTLLLAAAAYSLTRRPYPAPALTRTDFNLRVLVDRAGATYAYPVRRALGPSICLSTGLLSGMTGVGGGILQVPLFVHTLKVPIKVAAATSQLIITTTALAATLTNLTLGRMEGHWGPALALTAGVVVGAQLGARLSSKLSSVAISRLLALGMAGIGIRLLAGVL